MKHVRLLLLSLAATVAAHADVTLPSLLTDHMVIQRGQPLHLWGKAAPAEQVTAAFRGSTATTSADDLGLWSLYLPPSEAGGPFPLTLTANNTITLQDILVGDVWVASGQSNMEFALRNVQNAADELPKAQDDQIRVFRVENNVATYPLDDVKANPWAACTPEIAAKSSAVAYFFARDLRAQLHIPIGIVQSYWGGTPAESWTSLRALSADASLMPVFATWAHRNDQHIAAQLRRSYDRAAWQRSADAAKAQGKPVPNFPWTPNDRDSWSPAGLYNAMIAPLTHFPIRGVIWYQGESNADAERAPLYARLFQTMIQDWRHAWNQPDFPFLFVQLANFKTDEKGRWPELREAQQQTLALRNTGMAVTIDIGNPTDIHPKNKQDVGHRLALSARAIAYGEKIEYSGPQFRTVIQEGNKLRLIFDHTTGGLTAKGPVTGFEIAGQDGKYQPATAQIEGDTIVVSNLGVPNPRAVRYAWSDNPEANLYNGKGLSASPFRSGE